MLKEMLLNVTACYKFSKTGMRYFKHVTLNVLLLERYL